MMSPTTNAKVIYQQRNELLEAADISEMIESLRDGMFHDIVRMYVPQESVEEQWDLKVVANTFGGRMGAILSS